MRCEDDWRLEISVLRNNTITCMLGSYVSIGMSCLREGLCFKFVILHVITCMPQGESVSRVMQQAEGSKIRHLVHCVGFHRPYESFQSIPRSSFKSPRQNNSQCDE